MFWIHRHVKMTTIINKSSTQSARQPNPFKPRIIQGKGRDQERNNYYDSGKYKNRNRSVSGHKFSR